MKKWIGLFMSVVIVASQWSGSLMTAHADALTTAPVNALTTDQKADILNQIHILSGDGNSYNLGGKLKRSEASTFIVKALGVQNTVLQQKDSYSKTTFKDVPSKEWYAPYVGYMTKTGIITGYPDGTFKPDEYISEKAFFSLVLKAMGYTGNDFDWNSINKVAFEAGLVEDIMYVFKEDDRSDYKRQDVVDTLFNALGKPMKGQNKKFIQLLVESGMVSMDKAALLNFVKIDKTLSDITIVKTPDYNQVEMVLNENIVAPTVDQVIVSLKETPTTKLTVKTVQMVGNVLTVSTDAQTEKAAYSIELKDVVDTDGNKVASVKKDFVGYQVQEVYSPYFQISKVEAINTTSVNIYFTQMINPKADIELLYDIYEGDKLFVEGNHKSIDLKRNDNKKNMITLTLKEASFVIGTEYKLKIKGDMQSAYNVNLNKGEGEIFKFRSMQALAVPTSINYVYSQEGANVYVYFSQPVDRDSAMRISNYAIKELDTGKSVVINQVYALTSEAVLNKAFIIKTAGLINTKNYEIVIKGVYDTYKVSPIGDQRVQFFGSDVVGDAIRLESVTAINNTTLLATFSREIKSLSPDAVINVEGGATVVMKELDPASPKNIKIYLSATTPLQLGASYTVRVYSGITDFMDKVLSTNLSATVIGNGAVKVPVAIESATFLDDSTIMIRYNQPIKKTSAVMIDKYDLFYSDGKVERLLIPGSVELATDTTVIIKIPYLLAKGTYRIQAKNIYDVSGQYSTSVLSADVK